MKQQAVICIVPTEAQADRIVYGLRSAGFNNADVSVVMPDACANKDLGHEKHTKAPEGAAAGTATGMVLGGALGWLAGVGALAIPGLGPFVAAGPIMAALSGAAIGGATGGTAGSLIGLGIPEIEAKQYETKLKDGNILLRSTPKMVTKQNALKRSTRLKALSTFARPAKRKSKKASLSCKTC
jgi:hypothetical protein